MKVNSRLLEELSDLEFFIKFFRSFINNDRNVAFEDKVEVKFFRSFEKDSLACFEMLIAEQPRALLQLRFEIEIVFDHIEVVEILQLRG